MREVFNIGMGTASAVRAGKVCSGVFSDLERSKVITGDYTHRLCLDS